MKQKTNTKGIILPFAKAVINIPTAGLGGAFIEAVQNSYDEKKQQRINDFMKKVSEQISNINIEISEEEFKSRIKKPEFVQLVVKIIEKIQHENRQIIINAYCNILTHYSREEGNVNFNKKLYFLSILDSLTEDHIHLLAFFYNSEKELRFNYNEIFTYTECYDITEPNDVMKKVVKQLNADRSSFVESLVSDLDSKKLIKKELDIQSEADVNEEDDVVKSIDEINTEVYEEFVTTSLGLEFYRFIKNHE